MRHLQTRSFYCTQCEKARVAYRTVPSFLFDFLLIIATFGLWLPVGLWHLLVQKQWRCACCSAPAYQRSGASSRLRLITASIIIAFVAIIGLASHH